MAADETLVPDLYNEFKTTLYILKAKAINHKLIAMTLTSLPNPDIDQLLFFMCGWTFHNLHETNTQPR